jgi:integrase
MKYPVKWMTEELIDDLKMDAKKLMEGTISEHSRKSYLSDFFYFRAWCIAKGRAHLPAATETVILYLTDLSKRKKYSTIARAATGIHRIYQISGMKSPVDSPEVKDLLRGIRRKIGVVTEQTKPLYWSQIIQMTKKEIGSFMGLRNRALIVLGWCGAFRRSELVGIDIEHIDDIETGIVITIPKSKTDQEKEGKKIFIPSAPGEICPVKLIRALRSRLNRKSGPLFVRTSRRTLDFFPPEPNNDRLSEQSVTLIVKNSVRNIGINPLHYSAHSLRRGFATEAARLGIPERLIAKQTRHHSMEVLRRYIDDGTLTQNNPLTFIYQRHISFSTMHEKGSLTLPEIDSTAEDSVLSGSDLQFEGIQLGVPFLRLVE